MEKAELVITALQQRIGEIVSQYELQNVLLRAEITDLVDKQKEREGVIEEISQALSKKGEDEQVLAKEVERLNTEIKILEKTNENLKNSAAKTTKSTKKA